MRCATTADRQTYQVLEPHDVKVHSRHDNVVVAVIVLYDRAAQSEAQHTLGATRAHGCLPDRRWSATPLRMRSLRWCAEPTSAASLVRASIPRRRRWRWTRCPRVRCRQYPPPAVQHGWTRKAPISITTARSQCNTTTRTSQNSRAKQSRAQKSRAEQSTKEQSTKEQSRAQKSTKEQSTEQPQTTTLPRACRHLAPTSTRLEWTSRRERTSAPWCCKALTAPRSCSCSRT